MTVVEQLAADVERWFTDMGFRVVLRDEDDGTWVDLISLENPDFRLEGYGSGPDQYLAIIVAEQIWKVEQDGFSMAMVRSWLGRRGVMPGETYVDKARERVRRASKRQSRRATWGRVRARWLGWLGGRP